MKTKKIFAGVLGFAALFALASCGNQNADNNTDKDPVVDPVDGKDETEEKYLKVTVLMPDGSKATTVKVQWCDNNGMCYSPVKVNSKGEAAFLNYKDNLTYSVHIQSLPEGYTYNPYEVVQDKNNVDSTLTLKALSTATGEGSQANPYVVTTGNYELNYKKSSVVYYSFTPATAGTYTIESFADTLDDPDMSIITSGIKDKTTSKAYSKDEGNEKNFKFTFDVTDSLVNTAIIFAINSAEDCEFYFSISK